MIYFTKITDEKKCSSCNVNNADLKMIVLDSQINQSMLYLCNDCFRILKESSDEYTIKEDE